VTGHFPRRGQIHWVDLNPVVGSEQSGVRPCVVISNDVSNENSSVIIVAVLTTRRADRGYPWDVRLPRNRPLREEGRIMGNQIRTVDKARLKGYLGELSADQIRQLEMALAISFGLGV
jgi:mRNA interferase MazF